MIRRDRKKNRLVCSIWVNGMVSFSVVGHLKGLSKYFVRSCDRIVISGSVSNSLVARVVNAWSALKSPWLVGYLTFNRISVFVTFVAVCLW